MARATTITPVLDGGVSQQPPDQRGESQCEAAENVVFDLGFGWHRRPGSILDRAFTEDAGRDLRIIPWDYGDQRYVVVYGRGASVPKLRIFQVGGNECTLSGFSGGNAGYDYINSGTATGMQIRPRRIEDYILWVNTTVASGTTTSADYSIERVRKDYDAVVSYSTTDGYYVKSEEDSERGTAGYWNYDVDGIAYSHINFQTTSASWSIIRGYWDDTNYGNFCGFRIAFRRAALTGFTGATFTTATGTITKVGAFTSYTFQQGDMIYVSSGTGFTAGWFRIVSRTSNDAIVISGGPGADNADTAANVTAATYSETNVCRIGVEVEAVINSQEDILAGTMKDMHDLALAFQVAMRAAGAANACCAWVPQLTGGGAFQITGPWRGSEGRVYAPTTPSSTGLSANGDLTNDATDPFYNNTSAIQVQISGTSIGTSAATTTPESRWVRVAAPNQLSAAIDSTKMPVKLVRNSATAFTIAADVFDQRATGDQTSNPAPPLILDGKKIYDVAHWSNRRVYAGEGGRIALSESGDRENFYIDNALNVVDSDPFNRTLPSGGASYVQFLVPFRQALVVFTSQDSVYEISYGDTLTPASASFSPSAGVRTQEVFPCPIAAYIYFLGTAGDYSRLREYFYDDVRVASDAGDVSLQVPRYAPGPARSMAVSGTHNCIFILADDTYEFYAHFFRYGQSSSAEGQKLLSAWAKWTFDGGYRICDIAVMRDDLWMLVENTSSVTTAAGSPTTVTAAGHGLSNGNTVVFDNATVSALNGSFVISNVTTNTFTVPVDTTALGSGTARMCLGLYTLETISLYRTAARTGYPYAIHLDRQVAVTGVHSAGTTTWTLPATPTVVSGSSQFPGLGSTINVGVEGPGFATPGTLIDTFGYTATTLTKSGNYSAGPIVFGRFFTSYAQVTRPFARTSDGRAIVADPLIVESVAVTHNNAGSYEIAIDPDYSVESLATRTMVAPFAPETFGFLTCRAGMIADVATIVVRTPALSPHPLGVSQIRFDGQYSPTGIVSTR